MIKKFLEEKDFMVRSPPKKDLINFRNRTLCAFSFIVK